MYISLKVSNNLQGLAKAFCEAEAATQRNVFEPTVLVTQTLGMDAWLRLKIAEHNGIAANLAFYTPNELINKIFFALGGSFQQPLPTQSVGWIIYAILGDKSFINKFSGISGYYVSDNKIDDFKRYGLAEKLADLFDQYQVYRPEMIENWNNGKSSKGDEKFYGDEAWQQHIWQKAKEIGGEIFPDKTLQRKFILEQLQSPTAIDSLKAKVKDINLFGLSIITQFHLHLYHEIGKHIPVNFYLLNPSPEFYWVEDKSAKELARLKLPLREKFNEGNELLSDLGKVQRETFQMLFSYDSFTNVYEPVGVREFEHNNLLNTVQQEVFESKSNNERLLISDAMLSDGSIIINSCYTEAREVESLYNYLVQLVDNNPGAIKERDILVLMPHVESYLPFIRATFDNAPYKFHYHVVGQKNIGEDSLFEALESILEISEDSFTAENVLSLLSIPLVKNKFSINDLAMIREVVQAAGIRYGIENSVEQETHFVSWQYGLKRIMYGLCISGEPLTGDGKDNFYPIDIIEGLSTIEVVNFVRFVELLIGHVLERKTKKSIADWTKYIEKAVDNFLLSSPDSNLDEQNALAELLADYNATGTVFADAISYAVLHGSLISKLQLQKEQRFNNGPGITFSSMIPMRSIPFKCISIIGLNNDVFPRRDAEVTFDLMRQFPKRGDRNRKENDKNLFLETLLSAESFFYISYLGRSPQDITALPPSSVVDTLLGYIEIKLERQQSLEETFIVTQPLHAYSRRYNTEGSKLKSFLVTTNEPVNILMLDKPRQEIVTSIISLDDIKRFFSNAIQFYYNKVLQVFYTSNTNLIEEHEVFEVDRLKESALNIEMMRVESKAIHEFIEKEKRLGNIPLANAGKVLLENINDTIHAAKKEFELLKGANNATSISADIVVGETTISGTVNNIYGNKLIAICKTSNPQRHLQNLYIDYLFCCIAGVASEAWLLNSAENIYELNKVSKQDALNKLNALISICKQGIKDILPYAAELYTDNRTESKYFNAIKKSYNEYIQLQAQENFFENSFETFDSIAAEFDGIINDGE